MTGIPVSALWGDYAIMLAGQNGISRLPSVVIQSSKGIVFLLVLAVLAWEISHSEPCRRSVWRHVLTLAVIFGSEVLLVSSNAQRGELPLLVLAAAYGAETIRRQSNSAPEQRLFVAVRNFGATLFLLFFMLPTFATDFKTIRYAARRATPEGYFTSKKLQSTPMNDFRFVFYGTRFVEMKNYLASVDEGTQLLRRHADPQMRLAAFLFSNPYHVALKLPPAKGGVICWSGTGLTERSHPPLKRMVGNANYILTGGGPDLDDQFGAICRPIYGAEWEGLHLQVIEKTEHFTLFKVPGSENKP